MKYFLYFVIALFFSYAGDWGPYYVASFLGDRVSIVGSISKFAETCNQSPLGDSECKVQYKIPKKIIQDSKNANGLGLGIILHAVEIICDGQLEKKITFGDPTHAGKTLDALQVYRVISLKDFGCSEDILIRAWSPKAYRRYGHIESPTVIGEIESVGRVKKFVELFRAPFLMIIAALFCCISIFNSILSQVIKTDRKGFSLDSHTTEWIGFSVCISGLANGLFPILSDSFLFTRLSNFFSIAVVSGPLVLLLSKSNTLPQKIFNLFHFLSKPLTKEAKVTWLHLFIGAYILSPFFARGLAPVILGVGFLHIIFGVFLRSLATGFFGLTLVSDSLKIFMVPYLPASHLFYAYALLCFGESFVARVQKSANLVGILRWAQGEIETIGKSKPIANTLAELADEFKIKQIALLSLKKEGGCEIALQKKVGENWKQEKFFRNSLPPIFAHVVTTREPVWHVEEDSLFAINLRKGESRKNNYEGSHFSVIPLIKDSIPVGAIAFTAYPSSLPKDDFYVLKLKAVTNLLLPFIASIVAHEGIVEREEWLKKCSEVLDEIEKTNFKESISEKNILSKLCTIISTKLDSSTYIGRFDPSSRKIQIKAFGGFDKEIENQYSKLQFYAVSHNEQGPLALAINRRKAITVGETSWIKNVLHPMTIEVFEKAKSQSCAAVPIFESGLDDQGGEDFTNTSNVWGVLWLESTIPGHFLPHMEASLQKISYAIQNLFSKIRIIEEHERATQALSGFMPKKVLARLVKGESLREEEEGYLLVADLRDSTKMSRIVGAEKWNEFTTRLTEPIEIVAKNFGYDLQTVIWDAFYFTKSGEKSAKEQDLLVEFSNNLNELFEQAVFEEFGDLGPSRKETGAARFCLVHGDISRDLRNAVTQHWTIVGGAMAEVSKLEQACKSKKGWFFASSSVNAGNEIRSHWKISDDSVPGTTEKILQYTVPLKKIRLSSEIYKLLEKSKKAA